MQHTIITRNSSKIDNSEIDNIVNSLGVTVKEKVVELTDKLKETLDFSTIEKEISEMFNEFSAAILEKMLNEIIQNPQFLSFLKKLGGRLGMHFVRYREINVRLYNGITVKVMSPYFVKARPKKRKKKRKKSGPCGPNGYGHLGLSALGFIGFSSANITSEIVKLAVLCPSLQVAKDVLSERGIEIDIKTIRRLCRDLSLIGLKFRGSVSIDGTENTTGHTLVIGIDGGRFRERRIKRGRKRKGQKRQGYYTEWKEPKLFTIWLSDNEGNKVRDFKPLYDATTDGPDDMFLLLQRYLDALDLSGIAKAVFCGDGAPWIWNRVEKMCRNFKNLNSDRIFQVIDYTHAKQNLNEIISQIPKNCKKKDKIEKQWKKLLWEGNIDGIYLEICKILKGKKKKVGINKWRNYFHKNKKRMQYQHFRSNHILCGSGCVESAIRRVINLRIKSAGSFWKKERAEYFLFLRSQLLSGRWLIFIRNAARRWAKRIINNNTIAPSKIISEKNIVSV